MTPGRGPRHSIGTDDMPNNVKLAADSREYARRKAREIGSVLYEPWVSAGTTNEVGYVVRLLSHQRHILASRPCSPNALLGR